MEKMKEALAISDWWSFILLNQKKAQNSSVYFNDSAPIPVKTLEFINTLEFVSIPKPNLKMKKFTILAALLAAFSIQAQEILFEDDF